MLNVLFFHHPGSMEVQKDVMFSVFREIIETACNFYRRSRMLFYSFEETDIAIAKCKGCER